jgi:hypothetical protein
VSDEISNLFVFEMCDLVVGVVVEADCSEKEYMIPQL